MRKIISLITISIAILLYTFLNKEVKLIDIYNNWVNDTTEVGVFSGTDLHLYPIDVSQEEISELLKGLSIDKADKSKAELSKKYYEIYRLVFRDKSNNEKYLKFTFYNDFKYVIIGDSESAENSLYKIDNGSPLNSFFENNNIILHKETVECIELFANELLQNNKITDLVNTYGTTDSKNIIINTNTEYCTFDDITILKNSDNFEDGNIYTIAGNISDNNLVCYITISYTNNDIVLSKIEVTPM